MPESAVAKLTYLMSDYRLAEYRWPFAAVRFYTSDIRWLLRHENDH